jgi:glycosyltransferase involved in cell wall biosynthesis
MGLKMGLKICLISTEYLPTPPIGCWGGIESVVTDLADALHRLDHDVTVVGCSGSRSPNKLFETFFSEPTRIGACERHFLSYKEFVKKFDGVVHDHSHGKMARLIHPNVIQTVHGRHHPSDMGYERIVAISRAQAEGLKKRCPLPRNIPVVYHGINAKRFVYKEEKSDRFLYFSVIARYKGAKVALEIAKETGIKIDFAGMDGDMTDAVRDCRLPNVRYIGQVSNEQRAELMANAKALIFPTGAFEESNWLESFGLVMLEALASGTPVIAAYNGATPEIVDHGKVGYICHSKAEMIEDIQNIENIDPRECRSYVENRFSNKIMALNYVKLYERVLRGESWRCTIFPVELLRLRVLRKALSFIFKLPRKAKASAGKGSEG